MCCYRARKYPVYYSKAGKCQDGTWVIVGIGVNLVSHPEETGYRITHLMDHVMPAHTGRVDPAFSPQYSVFPLLTSRFEKWKNLYDIHGFAGIKEAWLARAIGMGGQVLCALAKPLISRQGTCFG